MAKKVNGTPKLTKVEKPESTQDDRPLIPWKPNMAGISLGGYIQEIAEFTNRFGKPTCIIEFSLENLEAPAKHKIHALLDELPCEVKFFRPAGLRILLEKVDTDGYVKLTYNGLDGKFHSFDVEAEKMLPEKKGKK